MEIIKNQRFDRERALYNIKNTRIEGCVFAGEADGESALKEARNVELIGCSFSLRYPLWHVDSFTLADCKMDGGCRAAIWYSKNGNIKDSSLNGIKAVRECENIEIDGCNICSPEFGWKSRNIAVKNSNLESEYLFFDSSDVSLFNVKMRGKYSFQYMKNLTVENSFLDTKDAFWHSENVTVRNSTVKGEYLGWFSKNLTLENCHIIGTQPLCYCESLTLINCTTEGCDLSFEYSSVHADIKGHILSVKNPASGEIVCDSIDEIITEDAAYNCTGKVQIRSKI